ncbi:hypothetical protein GCM10012290_18760 [Halolactibacillus alkaliphilus]|uniref:Uncharacterized protein n=1 Tax=Halolactibacillus alkaliphilus TaxID=442899 RepID=A0A511X2N2_9BACI|nr:hypothetical protein [Halolactibacillus alkaliphilus]GEN57202.1 hypothetical protein HAL01_16660 [Halolactibacillus alkaliphilus]GGN72613.1 hypothetical protein GCM10012290_18760 [Halolactibacillus alkaliphilus]SFO90975.1 hypothetical protein SAMN05720591_12136 [Halolactibacillus alkaliphilus]
MEKYNVELTVIAENDLLEIVKHITFQLFIPVSALIPIRIQETYRQNYIVFFSINEKERIVDVERILYPKHDWLKFL